MKKLLLAAALAFAPAPALAQAAPAAPPGRRACPGRRAAARRRSGALGGARRRHDHLSVRHLPPARRPPLVQRRGQDRVRRLERAGAGGAPAGGHRPRCSRWSCATRSIRRAAPSPRGSPPSRMRRSTAALAARRAGRRVRPVRALVRVDDPGRARRPAARRRRRQRPGDGADRAPPAPATCRSASWKASNGRSACSTRCPRRSRSPACSRRCEENDQLDEKLAPMLAAWSSGDVERLAALMDEKATTTPRFHRLLFTDRNATWARWIQRAAGPARHRVRRGRRRPPRRPGQRPGGAPDPRHPRRARPARRSELRAVDPHPSPGAAHSVAAPG